MGAGVDGRLRCGGWERLVKWICYCSISRDCDTLAKKSPSEYLPDTCVGATYLAVYGIAFARCIAVLLP